jgi:preprotein translocase subunit SecF
MQYGLAAIVALVHDVTITLGLVAGAHFVYRSFVGQALGLLDFKIDLPMIAAFLTIIGYSLNDTIVVFDRIRENRGKLKNLTPAIMNNSINQCLSRTVLTSMTTFVAVAIMYAFGGAGIHGFSYALMIGVIVGTYSSVGIATPLLYRPKVLHSIVYILIALALFAGFSLMVGNATSRQTLITIAGVVLLGVLAWAINLEVRSARRGPAVAT